METSSKICPQCGATVKSPAPVDDTASDLQAVLIPAGNKDNPRHGKFHRASIGKGE